MAWHLMRQLSAVLVASAAFLAVVPANANPVSLIITYEANPPLVKDSYDPWFQFASANDSFHYRADPDRFWLRALEDALGVNNCIDFAIPFCVGLSAGGYASRSWDIGLGLTGPAGTEHDVYLNWRWDGGADAFAFGLGYSEVQSHAQLVIRRGAAGTLLYDTGDLKWHRKAEFADVYLDEHFGAEYDHIFIGTMTIGNPELDTLSLQGFHGVNADAYAAWGWGEFLADMVSLFEFDITTVERGQPPPAVPEPGTLALLGAGVVGASVVEWLKRRRAAS